MKKLIFVKLPFQVHVHGLHRCQTSPRLMRYPSMIVESPSSRVVQMLARAPSPPFDHLGAGGLQSFSPDSRGRPSHPRSRCLDSRVPSQAQHDAVDIYLEAESQSPLVTCASLTAPKREGRQRPARGSGRNPALSRCQDLDGRHLALVHHHHGFETITHCIRRWLKLHASDEYQLSTDHGLGLENAFNLIERSC